MNFLYAALVAAVISAYGTWQVQEWRHDSIELERADQQRETSRMQRQAANTASGQHETDKAELDAKFEPIKRGVDHAVKNPAYATACFDDLGMREHAEAVRATGNTSEPVHPMPAASAPH